MNSAKTHCLRMHVFDDTNTIRTGNQRRCRQCKRRRDSLRELTRDPRPPRHRVRTRNKAHSIVANAVRGGRLLKRPCRDCGSKTVHGHHPDYSRPLYVIWLCPIHHRAEHERLKKRA